MGRTSSSASRLQPYQRIRFWQENRFWQKGIMSINGTEVTWGNPLYSEKSKDYFESLLADKIKNTKALSELL